MIPPFEFYAPAGDRTLLARLGLRTEAAPGDDGWCRLGTIEPDADSDGKAVEVAVCCMPARFWRFTVGSVVLSTGSGNFSDYWSVPRMIASGMLDVDAEEEVEG